MHKGFLKVLTVTPKLVVGNPKENVKEMIHVLKNTHAQLVVFPELALTGYTCGDLFYQDFLLSNTIEALKRLLEVNFKGIVIVGMPIALDGGLYNVAVVIQGDKILGVIPKLYLPNTGEFAEKRWFNSGLQVQIDSISLLGQTVPFGHILFEDSKNEVTFGIEICQDMWTPITPGNLMGLEGANLIVNLSASNEFLEKEEIRRRIVLEHSRKNHGAYLYTSSGSGESSSETVFSGHNIHAQLGKLIREEKFTHNKTEGLYSDIDFGHINYTRRKETNLKDFLHKFNIEYKKVKVSFPDDDFYFSHPIDPKPFKSDFDCVRRIQTAALYKRLEHLNFPKLILGLSGGLDSSLALMVAYDTLKSYHKDPKLLYALFMPGMATSQQTKKNAEGLARGLGIKYEEKSIVDEAHLHFKVINQAEDNHDITYENTQARIRTMMLMNIANKEGGIVLGTGNLSEIALGFMTYNGDMMSMYAINSGLPKGFIKTQLEGYGKLYPEVMEVIQEILNTPISPELVKNQKTEAIIGSYEKNDFLIYRHLVCGDNPLKLTYMLQQAFAMSNSEAEDYVNRFMKRFYSSQFKRQTLPDGPKVIEFSLSPRGDYRLSSDVKL